MRSSLVGIVTIFSCHADGATAQTAQTNNWAAPTIQAQKPTLLSIQWSVKTTGPYGHAALCDKTPESCDHIRGNDIKTIITSPDDLAAMERINREVDTQITPMLDRDATPSSEEWRDDPTDRGDCEDSALLKIKRLLKEYKIACSIAVVKDENKEGHAVGICAAGDGYYHVLDIKTPGVIKIHYQTPYEWIMVNDPRNPRRWHKVLNGIDDLIP